MKTASPFVVSLAGGALSWASLPPLGWWSLAWLAPLCWLKLVVADKMTGRRPYLAIWLASVIYWIVVLQGVRLAHWANYFSLVALGCYLGVYLPLFIAIARSAIHRWRLPLILVAPVAWTGIELFRGYGPLGFSVALLGHTQVSQLAIIQISDLFGAYAVSFVILFVASCVVRASPTKSRGAVTWPLLAATVVLGSTLAYGWFRLSYQHPNGHDENLVRIALIQGSIDTSFDSPVPASQVLEQYDQLTDQACQNYGSLDLVVWPETMFPIDDVLVDDSATVRFDPPWNEQRIHDNLRGFDALTRTIIRRLNDGPKASDRPTSWLLGTTSRHFGDFVPRRYNAALMVDPSGKVVARYFKMHPVIFGEYVPFGEQVPWLYQLFPLPNGLTAGTEPTAISVADLVFAPSICFESTMPHLIRKHVVALARRGTPPDVLVNLTNDGWFWGSSVLDMQLDCSVFRAIEMRRPFLVAANTGFSAAIDGNGRVLQKGPRRATGTLLAEVQRDGRTSMYELWGDGPAALCLLFCLAVSVMSLATKNRKGTVELAEPPLPAQQH